MAESNDLRDMMELSNALAVLHHEFKLLGGEDFGRTLRLIAEDEVHEQAWHIANALVRLEKLRHAN